MSQRNVTTSTPQGYTGYTIATMQAAVNTLVANMAAGKAITATDVATLVSIYNGWRTHNHTASDQVGIDTFGNLTTYGASGLFVTATSAVPSPAMGTGTLPGGVSVEQGIAAADINSIIGFINSMRSHYHTITDSVGGSFPSVSISSTTSTLSTSCFGDTNCPSTNFLTFASNGQMSSGTGLYSGQWIDMEPVDVGTANDFDIFVTASADVGVTVTGSALSTWLNLGTTRTFTITNTNPSGTSAVLGATLSVQIRNASTLTVLDTATYRIEAYCVQVGGASCFPPGSQVLMPDGSWRAIETIRPGDVVMGGNGSPAIVTEMERPFLGNRRLMTFADGSLVWSEEHAMWTRNSSGSQWWWSAGADLWKQEALTNHIGGLFDNNSIRTGNQVSEWAHTSGWKANTVEEIPNVPPEMQLCLPRTAGIPIIVNGYVVGAGVNQHLFDYATLDWDTARQNLPVVQPLPAL